MRKHQLEQGKKYISLLGKINEALKLGGEPQGFLKNLQLAQEKAIELGTYLEECGCVECKTIEELERFCESLYQISLRLEEGDASGIAAGLEELDIELAQAERELLLIPIRREVVFLPYKASMWDSLESVWKRAEEDSEADAYVIPIPYYDKNQDGSLGDMHYEGDLYPDYVPITKYDEYDFGARRPDEIYIHNPYDNNNYVTTVHPFFYSDKLREMTDKLVYIPYYVMAEPDPTSDATLEHLMPYVCQPGVLNSHLTIVQSEAMKRAYVNCLCLRFGTDKKAEWEEKIQGLGSPKFEKVKSLRKEEQDIPEDWMKLIEKPDGSWKKIILYNVGVSTFANVEDKLLDKLEDSLRIFEEYNERVVLLWRPHPLMEKTIESLKPECLERYRKIVSDYRKAGWGIYDDTPDMDRAIAISDAYYGDPSSLVQLCQAREMPVMIENVNIIEGE